MMFYLSFNIYHLKYILVPALYRYLASLRRNPFICCATIKLCITNGNTQDL